MNGSIQTLTIKGFKSIKEVTDFKLNDLNIIIGANGVGKSNLIQIFDMLAAMSQKNFSQFIMERGGSDSFLYNGPKETKEVVLEFVFTSNSQGNNSYKVSLIPTANEKFGLLEEYRYDNNKWRRYGAISEESRIFDLKDEKSIAYLDYPSVGYYIYDSISKWFVYHFHDTSATAPMRRSEIIDDNKILRGNASNIAPFLLNLKKNYPNSYDEIVKAIKLIAPYFDDFILDVIKMGESEKVKLSWKQKGSNFPMQPYHFSDGTIRFICLATALLQPNPPSTLIIDEPELGLHPAAISILSELIQATSKRTQVIIATQSPLLIDMFSLEDIVVMDRENGASIMKRLDAKEYDIGLEEYSIGELWRKNIIKGGPFNE